MRCSLNVSDLFARFRGFVDRYRGGLDLENPVHYFFRARTVGAWSGTERRFCSRKVRVYAPVSNASEDV